MIFSSISLITPINPPRGIRLYCVRCDRCNGADARNSWDFFFFFFFSFGTLRRPMAERAESWLAGSGGDRRAPVPITESVGGVQGLGGVSEEYESTAA